MAYTIFRAFATQVKCVRLFIGHVRLSLASKEIALKQGLSLSKHLILFFACRD